MGPSVKEGSHGVVPAAELTRELVFGIQSVLEFPKELAVIIRELLFGILILGISSSLVKTLSSSDEELSGHDL